MGAQNIDERAIKRARLIEFFSTLDLKCEIQSATKSTGLSPFLVEKFGSSENFWAYAKQLQGLVKTNLTDKELISQVAAMLTSDALYFLVLMHLHRQIRFTNVELVNALFDADKFNDIQYYRRLVREDQDFEATVKKVSKSKGWISYVGAFSFSDQSTLTSEDRREVNEEIALACFKKAVTKYLGSEKKCWSLWEARIHRDQHAPMRVAKFAVENEDLKEVITEKAVVSALARSLRIVNVEVLKRNRGEYGSKRVREILESAGFKLQDSEASDIQEIERKLPTSSEYLYLSEVPWKEQDKVFDFVLARRGKIGFVIESNYYTTSMSKIREVVKHFRELKIACRGKYRLIYITDGMGWFNLMKTVNAMLEFEEEEMKIEPTEIPYLMSLEQFRRDMPQIKATM
jgi:hypothetical protein